MERKRSKLSLLFDSTDNTVAASTVYLFATLTVSLILLLIPAIALIVDVWFNHTITTDLSGLASYIGAASAIGGSGGLLKGITNYATYKFNASKHEEEIEADTE